MGISVQQWRATIGLWSGGRPGKSVTLQNCIAQTSNHNGYRLIRLLVLVSLLVIGCVELNPGPDNQTASPSQNSGALPKFSRRPGTGGLHGELYEIKMAAFLFARALNRTEEFRLASNVDCAGAFDDLVFRYRLREPNVWRTCFIQLKHKKDGGAIQRSSLTQLCGDFSLLKYFSSYCQIKAEAFKHNDLKQCGNFPDFEFIIYTNGSMESKSAVKGGDADPVSILSSGSNCGQYITFEEIYDTDIFTFFEELSRYHDFIIEMDSLLNGGTFVDKEINEKIKSFQRSVTSKAILGKLNSLKSKLSKDYVRRLKEELDKCDFSLFKEFLSKVKIFHSETNEESLKTLIEKELKDACATSFTVANCIYAKFYEGLNNWWKESGSVVWLSKNSELWQAVEKYFAAEITDISEAEVQEVLGCGIHFSQQHIQRLSDVIKQNTFLNIITNSNIRTLHKLKTHQALSSLDYTNSIFISLKSLMVRRKEIRKLWPCKWSDAMVIDCDCDGNVADTLLDIVLEPVDCEQGSDNSDGNMVETFLDILQKYQKKVILISRRQHKSLASHLRKKLGNIFADYEDNFNLSDFDEKSQKQILERTVNFQGTNVALQTLVGTDPPEIINHIDSDVISVLLYSEEKLCVGRKLSEPSKIYVQRTLQHRVYLKNDILKLTDSAIAFAVSGVQADQLKKYLPAGEKICEFIYDESERSHSFRTFADFSKPGLSAEWGTMKTHHEIGQRIKPKEVRYIILSKTQPESDFSELKAVCTNVHWIHVEDGTLLWRESNCDIDIIRRYIDDTKCKKYDIKSVMEHNDRTMLLVAEPGMGKSTFLSHMEHEIKEWNSSVWVLRINMHKHTSALEEIEFENKCIDNCKDFLWNAAHSHEKRALTFERKIFLQALEQREKLVIILDGFDEISLDYSPKVTKIIRTIIDKTSSKVWVSSRFPYRQDLEDMVIKLAYTLQPFTIENQMQFLEQYWSGAIEISKQKNLRLFAENLLSLCSQNFSDKDGEFTGIPLQIMMLGEAFVKETEEYCSSGKVNLPENINLLALFRKFTEKKFNIYFREKNELDSSKLEAKSGKKLYLAKHVTSALMTLFSTNEVNRLLGAGSVSVLEQTEEFLRNGTAKNIGIITEFTDGKPYFIHRCFVEYFAARWFADNFKNCEDFISDTLFISTYEVTRNIFDRMLAEDSEIHGAVLNNDIVAVSEFMKKIDINISDKGGRTALHLAASYNSHLTLNLLSVPGVDANKPDAVLKWTPLRYADRSKSWMAMDILLQNGANTDDIVLTRRKIEDQEWGQAALWECASKGHKTLLEFMLNCGTDANAAVGVPENLHDKGTLLHRASLCGQVEVVRLLADRCADINIRNAENETALHLVAESGSVDIIKLLLDKGMTVNLTNSYEYTPLHVSAQCGNLEATKALVESGAGLNNTDIFGNTPLMGAASKGKLELVRYLTQIGADINIRNANNNTALHLAACWDSLDIIKLLLDKGMTVNLTNSNEDTPLHVSAECGNLEATKTLVESGAGLNKTNKYGETPLMQAALKGKLELVRYLTQIGADINIRNAKNDTALHFAAMSCNVDIIKLLLDKGMTVNLTDSYKYTPLHVSAKYGKLEATKTLVESGAGLNNTNKYGDTPVMLAASEGKLELVRYLTQIGADINIRNANNYTALHFAAMSDNVDIIKLLLDKGMSVNLTNSYEYTPLHVSAEWGNLKATKALVQGGAGLNNTNKYGKTPVMLAAYHGNLELVRYLSQIGADVNIRNANNYTALHLAAESGNVDIINLLLDKGMTVNLTDSHKSTPLHVSAECGNLEATKAFVEAGAALNKTNINGDTPLMLAKKSGKSEVVHYLKGKDTRSQQCFCL